MNREELKERLRTEDIMESAFCLDGGLPGDCYTLAPEEGRWSVYYSERGEKNSFKSYETEHDACMDLLNRVLRDPTTRKRV